MSIIRDLTATIPSLLVIPVGLAIVKRFAEQTNSTTTPTTTPIGPLIPITKPTPVVTTPLIKPMTQITPTQLQAFRPQTPEQAALTRERITAPSGTPEQAALIAQAYRPGKVTPLGFRQGETTDDLIRRLYSK